MTAASSAFLQRSRHAGIQIMDHPVRGNGHMAQIRTAFDQRDAIFPELAVFML